MTDLEPDFFPLVWMDIAKERPGWGFRVLVYRGRCDSLEGKYRENIPPVFEVTNKYDSMITHWAYLVAPVYSSAKKDLAVEEDKNKLQ